MSVSIDISTSSDSLDLFGEPDKSSAYSFSGHVSITITPRSSIFSSHTPTRIILQSIDLTFEGQCEVIAQKTGYSSARLCTISRELLDLSQPAELNTEGHEDEECSWNVAFNVPVPGWLPATSRLGRDYDVGVKYFAYATVKYTCLNDFNTPSIWNFCSPFGSRVQTAFAEKDVHLRRLIMPPRSSDPSGPVVFSEVGYLVNGSTDSPVEDSEFPSHLLGGLEVLAIVPEYVDMRHTNIPLELRLRTKGLEPDDCKRLQLSQLSVDVVQLEKARRSISSEYSARYQLPPRRLQPPNEPLRHAHSIHTMFELGFYASPLSSSESRSVSFLPPNDSGTNVLAPDTYPFANIDTDKPAHERWYTLEASIPFTNRSSQKPSPNKDWAGELLLRPSVTTPLYSFQHQLQVTLLCSYDLPSGRKATRKLYIHVPIQFAHVGPLPGSRASTPELSSSPLPSSLSDMDSEESDDDVQTPLLVGLTGLKPSRPYAQQTLPPYSHLYHSNGDRKIDYTDTLPLYTPSAPVPSSSSLEDKE